MTRTALTAVTAAIVGFVAIGSANATVRTFFSPNLYGDRISACVGQGTVCGKPVADKLCTVRGFTKALTFRLDRTTEPGERLRTIENEMATGEKAEPAFVFVKCYSPNVEARLTID
ncbi:MAG: hypothetical protein ACR2OR_11110 [Hyphomicrobiales bacterium]